MIIGSHNTMSYQPIRQWYLKPFFWMAKCQSKSLQDQFIKYGCRLFDFRIRLNDNGDLTFAHGAAQFHGHVATYISELNDLAANSEEPVYARLILESNSPMKNQEEQEDYFSKFCERMQKENTNITFFGGRRKYDWAKIYEFGTVDPELDDKYSSTTSPFGEFTDSIWDKIDDLWPWLYARLHNKKNIKNGTNKEVLLMDYVNIR